MSIDWLNDLERSIEYGKEIFGCPGVGQNEWVINKPLEDLRKVAQRAADLKKLPMSVMRVVSKIDVVAGDNYLVPTSIDNPGNRGEPVIKWKVVETKEAAEMLRDVKFGPSPFFGIQILETINPKA